MNLESLVIPISLNTGILLKGVEAVIGAFGSVISSTDDWGNKLDKIQDSLGGTSKEAAGLALAAQKINMPVDKAVGLFDKMAKGLKNAKGELGPTGKLLENMGVQVFDAQGKIRPFSDLIGEVATKISNMPDGLDKTNLEMQLFGKTGAEAGDLMAQLANGGMQAVIDQADAMGLAIDPAVVKAYDAAWATLQANLKGFGISAGATLFPFLDTAFTKLNTLVSDIRTGLKTGDWSHFWGDADMMWDSLKTMVEGGLQKGIDWLNTNPTAITDFIDGFLGGLTGAMNAEPDDKISQLAQTFANKVGTQIGNVDWSKAADGFMSGLWKAVVNWNSKKQTVAGVSPLVYFLFGTGNAESDKWLFGVGTDLGIAFSGGLMKSLNNLSISIQTWINGVGTKFADFMRKLPKTLSDGYASMYDGTRKWLKGFEDGVYDAMVNAYNTVIDWINKILAALDVPLLPNLGGSGASASTGGGSSTGMQSMTGFGMGQLQPARAMDLSDASMLKLAKLFAGEVNKVTG